ncbi:DEAD/DEAH box helicase [Enterococcus faecium]|uniref:DEAD/DEAH box helicase n=1 Tax=Enterococcus faecium TaxID=1352 RepID=UPI00100FB8A7|nr:DEAD/DEAH box helicase [Enterococcus faecium]MCD5100237.1 DEAD/DEAH box helicase [Enterococcus faecium]RXW34563.1 DEAD/DEAH box helicase [Enterococcus faecium]TKN23483.1 DEAD/DEAH box helicase [Enterococcus faecium]TKO81532.1 DEAD/DEAH box helicase [Enterococcus faecium]
MFEYGVPLEEHIQVEYMAQELIILAIATIGDASNFIWDNRNVGTSLSLNDELIENLNFTSIYFNSLITSKIGESNYNDYFGILGAISFYLSDSLGSTKVMLNKIDWSMDLEVNGIETVLLYLMADRLDDLNGYKFPSKYIYSFYSLIEEYSQFYSNGTLINIESLVILKQKIYESQNPREILFGDALLAVFIKKYKNASLNLLPNYSGTTIEDWNGLLLNNSSIKELWPSQILLGKESIFKGSSGVIQMPTSSGKTTSIGLIIRSAFITNRTKLAIVVAPFKALCKEITLNLTDFFSHDEVIVNELSDIAEKDDIDFFDTTEKNTLIILTPEKLLFLIRNKNEILEDLNLIIFDEAHLFDDNSRGTNYELLISTIKYYLKKSSQKILISAVITNSSMINDWLNDGDGKVISNNNIISAQRSIAMGDWIGHTGQLYFLNQENPDIDDFYVPKIVDIQEINKLGRERVKRYFPDVDFKKKKLNNAYDMQIYYALKMIHNGATAIFSGTKASADKTIERILEIERRGLPIAAFSNNNNADENIKIANLIKLNLGDSATYYYAALKGVFIHHGNIPSGIRTSIEYAMSHNLINFVVCTSTLAQGVNLPIKYLIISNLYQGQSQIKVRDFHNLLGRTGRAGKHIEGTVILSEPFVHSNKRDWKWRKYKSMLNIANSEDSLSNLLKLVRDIDIKNLPSINLLPLILLKYSNSDEFNRQNNLLKQVIKKEFPESYLPFSNELQTILNSLNDVENYVMFFMNYFGKDEANFTNIVTKQTLGYQLASEDEKEKLIHLFDTIKNHSLLLTKGELNLYTITSLGFDSSKFLSQWLSEKIEEINQVNSEIELVNIIFPQLVLLRENALVKKITDSSIFSKLCELWIQGESYREILIYCQNNHFTLIRYNKLASFTIQDVIEICDSILAYSTILPLNGIVAFMNDSQNNLNINLIKKLQKKIRYGLPNNLSINPWC